MRIEAVKIDTRDTTPTGRGSVEQALNDRARKIEGMGNKITGEDAHHESDSVEAYFTLVYEKGTPTKRRYKYLVFDIRGLTESSMSNVINQELITLEKAGNVCKTYHKVPKRNSAFTQVLIGYEAKVKEVE